MALAARQVITSGGLSIQCPRAERSESKKPWRLTLPYGPRRAHVPSLGSCPARSDDEGDVDEGDDVQTAGWTV